MLWQAPRHLDHAIQNLVLVLWKYAVDDAYSSVICHEDCEFEGDLSLQITADS